MGKIFKVSGYVYDTDMNPETNKLYTKDGLECDLHFHDELDWRHLHIEEGPVLPAGSPILTDENCDLALCEQYFQANPEDEIYGRDIPKAGEKYRHFKIGKVVEIIHVAQNTECPGTYQVIYSCCDEENKEKIWARPLGMFLSPVDREKYPNASQEWRFEKVEE